ncbi:DnaJ-like protein DjlA [hydrothermal vent metagenome]|uniref:DnaJ-like protein DjlA n=1 Tax=hydrothermal vent metagenome TaxID=652676 RepID=A0A3B1AP78_9ZZZZ
MGWWGKVVGGTFGFMLGGPLGALLGAALGHNLDKGLSGLKGVEGLDPGDRERVQTAFFTATFSVMGHIAKADGRVSPDEIAMAEAVMAEMNLSPELYQTAQHLFNEGKSDDFLLDEVLEQFRQECHRRNTLIQMFLELQIQAAYADGSLDSAEERLLLHICSQLGISEFVFRRLEQMIQAEHGFAGARGRRGGPAQQPEGVSLQDAYAILNSSPEVSDGEIKKSYRRLLSQHHPDKLVAKGLPEEMMKVATRKTHEIRKAYEKVKEARGL